MAAETPPPEELWRVSDAVRYLNAGPVDLKINHRAVQRMADNPNNRIQAFRPDDDGHRWRWLLASTVRAERARRLAVLGFDDPEWPVPGPSTS